MGTDHLAILALPIGQVSWMTFPDPATLSRYRPQWTAFVRRKRTERMPDRASYPSILE
jgi:hypothetical protein